MPGLRVIDRRPISDSDLLDSIQFNGGGLIGYQTTAIFRCDDVGVAILPLRNNDNAAAIVVAIMIVIPMAIPAAIIIHITPRETKEQRTQEHRKHGFSKHDGLQFLAAFICTGSYGGRSIFRANHHGGFCDPLVALTRALYLPTRSLYFVIVSFLSAARL